jgi:FKBP-type peptidyl-prolyl cis-trans isomerase FkpA
LLLLNEGSKATFIVPSSIGYGERGNGPDIPGYSTLVFDVELVKIKPGKHAAASKPAAGKTPVKKPGAKKTAAKKKS